MLVSEAAWSFRPSTLAHPSCLPSRCPHQRVGCVQDSMSNPSNYSNALSGGNMCKYTKCGNPGVSPSTMSVLWGRGGGAHKSTASAVPIVGYVEHPVPCAYDFRFLDTRAFQRDLATYVRTPRSLGRRLHLDPVGSGLLAHPYCVGGTCVCRSCLLVPVFWCCMCCRPLLPVRPVRGAGWRGKGLGHRFDHEGCTPVRL